MTKLRCKKDFTYGEDTIFKVGDTIEVEGFGGIDLKACSKDIDFYVTSDDLILWGNEVKEYFEEV